MLSEVKRRPLGQTGLEVSEVSFGAMNLRMLDTIEEAENLLDHVLTQGINLIDTARAYNGDNGTGQLVESEVLVGEAVARRKDLYEPIVIVTKGHGYTLDALEEELSTSREKLGITTQGDLKMGTNSIKLVYFFHGINEERWKTISNSGVLDRIQAMRDEGMINHIGFSSHYGDGPAIKKAIDTGIFEVVELPYNVFSRELGEDGEEDILRYAYERGLGIINMKAFNGNGMVPIHALLADFLRIDHPTMLRFCLANPCIATVDAGARYVSEFSQDIEAAADKPLTAEEIEGFKREADTISDDLKGICRECMHCQEKFSCPSSVDFPRILSLYGRASVAAKLGHDISNLQAAYQELEVNALDCTACGECQPWCEYKLDIPTMLNEAHAVLS